MKDKFIQKYVDMLTINDIFKFARNNNVELSNNEANIIYKVIKNEWKTIVFDDYKYILNKYKNDFTVDKLNKMEQLIIIYKDKYKNFI